MTLPNGNRIEIPLFRAWARIHARAPAGVVSIAGRFVRFAQFVLTVLLIFGPVRCVLAQSPCAPCDPYQPRWFATIHAVYMDRVRQSPQPLMQNVSSPAVQLNARDFEFASAAGIDTTISCRSWDESAWELRYVDLSQIDAHVGVVTNASSLRINASPPVFASNVQRIDARYSTDLMSFEANHLYAIDDWKLICGLRYVGLDEDLFAGLEAGLQTFPYLTQTRNDLYGLQIGTSYASSRPMLAGFHANGSVKIGAYANDVRHFSAVDTGVTALSVHRSPGRTTFLGELSIGVRRPLWDQVSLIAGYGLIWVDRLAVAADQIRATDFFNGIGTDTRGHVVLHGMQLGVEIWL